MSRSLVCASVLALLPSLLWAPPAVAQATATDAASSPSPRCDYQRCALGIVPAWNGLLVTRGATEQRVANLGFFWTRSLEAVFAGSDSAQRVARGAVRVRRVAAVLTDVGALAVGYAAVSRLSRGEWTGTGQAVGLTGAVLFGASVPLHFAADGLLSRAIWWKNAEYAPR
jgi:hypothetical protein